MRKLLPYEHQLIEELNITKEDYLAFLQVQFDYTTTPEKRLEKPQADLLVVAQVLVIIGTILQVVGALLVKPPSEGKRAPREQTFAPRLGFNSSQELGKYGDPVNLIYTNAGNANISQNERGGVRVATSLVWSAIESFGSSQYMQMMLVLGGGPINAIDPNRMAFGQTPIRQFQAQSVWLYYNKDGNPSGLSPVGLIFNNIIKGDANDPSRKGGSSTSLVYQVNPNNGIRQQGFSQTFSPTTLTKCGVFSPIPINVDVVDRLSNGKPKSAPIGITVDNAFLSAYWPESGFRPKVPLNAQLVLTFAKAQFSEQTKTDVIQTASEKRRSLLESLDFASIYMLGSARFRLASILPNADLEENDCAVTFICIEEGYVCKEKYSVLTYRKTETAAADEAAALQQEIADLQTQLTANPPIYKSADIEAELNAKLNEINLKTSAYTDFVENSTKLKTITDITFNSFYPVEINNLITAIDKNENRIEDLRAGASAGSGFGSRKEEIKYLTSQIKQQTKDLQRQLFVFFDDEVNLTSPTSRARQKALQAEINALNIQAIQLASNTTIRDLDAEATRNAEWQATLEAKQLDLATLEAEGYIDNYYHTKCLVKVEEAAYETITAFNVIDFALRARVFQRISNRSRRYGEKKEEQFKNSDNGTKLRSSFFRVGYRKLGQVEWNIVNRIFVIRRGNDVDNYVSLKFGITQKSEQWQFKFFPIAETAAEMLSRGDANFAYIDNQGSTQTIDNGNGTYFHFLGTLKARVLDLAPLNNSPAEIDEWSLFSTRSDTQVQFSFDNGPEIEIKAVTEQSIESLSSYPRLYKKLSLIGFNAYSGQGIQDLRSISAFVTQGKSCTVITGPNPGSYFISDSSSSLAPDIFLDTVLDTVDGIGRFTKQEGIDFKNLWLSRQFCVTNKLFMDGVIAELTPWRQFWAEVAPYSLLELGRIGGRETLIPAVPCNNAGVILDTTPVPISALFNTGNILENSYKEEFLDYGTNVQDLIATVIYRDTESDNTFPRNRSVDVSFARAANGSALTDADAVRQTFDVSQFVTNRSQAIMYAKLLCSQRRHIRKSIEFRTFPTDSVLSPGAYIYVDIGQAQWNNIYSGSVEGGGALNTPISSIINGLYNVLLWKPGQSSVVPLNNVNIVNNVATALTGYDGWLFVLGTNVKSKRVFKIAEVAMDEEGEVTVKAIDHPCDANGNSLITKGLTNINSADFTITG